MAKHYFTHEDPMTVFCPETEDWERLGQIEYDYDADTNVECWGCDAAVKPAQAHKVILDGIKYYHGLPTSD